MYRTWILFIFYFYFSEAQAKMASILDQKNYLEELNRHLQ